MPLVIRGLIGGRTTDISHEEMQRAVAPNALRLREMIEIDLTQLPDTAAPHYWTLAKEAIDKQIDALSRLEPRGNRSMHVSVFALAAIPLLAYVGSRLSDKIHVDLYQRHRNPETWSWRNGTGNTAFTTRTVRHGTGSVALAINVSGTIPTDSITAVADDCTLYELGVKGQPATPLVLNTGGDLNRFVSAYVSALEFIRAAHPGVELLHVFPAVPAPIAITLGRHILPKVGPKLLIYDHDKRSGGFSPTVTIEMANLLN